MTLDTRVFVHDRVDYREAWIKCNQLIGATEGTKFTDEPVASDPAGAWWIWNTPGQGLLALLDIRYRKDGPLRALPEAHDEDCEPGCTRDHRPACWLEASFDTPYGYRGPGGEGCGDLHARLVAELGQWLDGKGVTWSWRNEFTGDIHQGYDGLDELCEGGAKATAWYRTIVAPVIAARGLRATREGSSSA